MSVRTLDSAKTIVLQIKNWPEESLRAAITLQAWVPLLGSVFNYILSSVCLTLLFFESHVALPNSDTQRNPLKSKTLSMNFLLLGPAAEWD